MTEMVQSGIEGGDDIVNPEKRGWWRGGATEVDETSVKAVEGGK